MNLAQLSLLAAGLTVTLPSYAAVLSVDINDASQPANTQSGFDALVTPGSPFASLNGTFNGVTLTVSGLGESLRSAVRTAPINNADLTTAALYQDFVYGGTNGGNGLSVLISGLTSNQYYTVQLWSFDAQATGTAVSDWTANGVVVAEKFSFDPNSYASGGFSFTVAASGSGAIYITAMHDPAQATGAAVFLNAIQVSSASSTSAPSPHTSSWLTTYSGQYARIYTNNAMKTSGISRTTWSNGSQVQNYPTYAGVQEIYSSAAWLYIRSSGLATHIMGPWQNGAFPNLPMNTKTFWRFPRTSSIAAARTLTPGGPIGYFVDGVAMFDSRDAFYWNGSTDTQGAGYWNRDAYVNESATFDSAYAHQPQDGTHHYHASPIALRYQLGDHVEFNPTTDTYAESANSAAEHSPILGWVADGFPVYGPYGFSSASNSASGIRRMISGYVIRNGQNGTSNLTANGRNTIPQWAVRLYNVPANVLAGPAVSISYPLSRYMEDNDYLGDLGRTQGVDFDLDECNGRWCVTPEFPNGTYAYFVSISSDGTPTFPYNIGRAYYGSPTGGSVAAFSETVATNFLGGPNLRESLNPPVRAGNDIVLTWSGIEGGTYRLEAENDSSGSNWASLATNIVSGGALGVFTETNGAAGSRRFYRTARTALAVYDPVSGTTGGGGAFVAPGGSVSKGNGTNITMTITLPNNPPQPPPNNVPTSVTLAGTINGTSLSRPAQGTVVATFAIPANAPLGAQNIVIVFNPAPTYTMTGAFTINP